MGNKGKPLVCTTACYTTVLSDSTVLSVVLSGSGSGDEGGREGMSVILGECCY